MKLNRIYILLFAFITLAFSQEKIDFKPGGHVFGEVFGDYFYKTAGDTIYKSSGGAYQKNKNTDNAFSLRRFYLGYIHHFSPRFETKVMFEGNDDQKLTNGKKSVNIKYYYLKWKNIFPGSDLLIGGQSTPTWSRFTEKIWGFRSIEKTIMDFRKQGGSSDFGVSLSGKLNKEKTIGYNLMVGNGTGQKPETDKYKKVYASINAKLLHKRLLLELYTDYEQKPHAQKLTTLKGFVGYQTDKLTIGVEPFQRIEDDSNKKKTNFGASMFVRGTVMEKYLNAFGRFDLYRPDHGSNLYDEDFFVAGLDYTPVKKVHIMPNIWINSYAPLNHAVDRKADVVSRLTFWYKF